MVNPYCEAGTCSDYLVNNPDADRMSIVSGLSLLHVDIDPYQIRQVADGLNHLHSFNTPIAHGDIKAVSTLRLGFRLAS